MSALPAATERYDPTHHDASQFDSGNDALDRWLIRYAGHSQRRDAARTFVRADTGSVIGYDALLAGELDYHQATEQTRKGMSRHYPIPPGSELAGRVCSLRSRRRWGLCRAVPVKLRV